MLKELCHSRTDAGMTLFPIGYTDNILSEKAQQLAEHYGFVVDTQVLPRLELTLQGLFLLSPGFSPLQVDFSRVLQGTKLDKSHALIRACKPTPGMRIVDATAGWGRDAALLAQAGAEVLLVEKQSVMAALLADGLQRLPADVVALSLLHCDASTYLQQLEPQAYPDLIYMDPMHPVRQKSALVKKDMQVLQQLFGSDENVSELIALAIKRARKKVVVKWPQRLSPLVVPQHHISGKTVRFDIYFS